MDTYILIFFIVSILVSMATLIIVLVKKPKIDNRGLNDEFRATRQELNTSIQQNIKSLAEVLANSQRQSGEMQDKRLSDLTAQLSARQETLQKTVHELSNALDVRFNSFDKNTEVKLENIRVTMETRIGKMEEENAKKLLEIKEVVDEKLQKTLNERFTQSFSLVSERLEQVYKGLGEMQTLAMGVGDLKKVLSNVKTRGILGEIQLGAILEQMLSPEQYEKNIAVVPNSKNVVEFAIKLPGDGEGNFVYLPMDAKFPLDLYSRLVDSYETGVPELIEEAYLQLERRIKSSAKDIHEKYISPPNTTDFAIMFLPVEGLYAEVVRRGLVEILQRDYKINIAGPTTAAALLNSLQLGFKTLVIQKRSSEVWNILGAVKTEFDKFGFVLSETQKRLDQANDELNKLVGVRTRAIRKKLNSISMLDEVKSAVILDINNADNEAIEDAEEITEEILI